MSMRWCLIPLAFSLFLPGRAAEPETALQIVRPVFRQYDGGPVLASTHQFLPGENLIFNFQISGFKETDNQFKLRYQVMVRDKDGVLLVEPYLSGTSGEISPEDRKSNWMPKVTYEFQLPPILMRGQYEVRVSVKDEVAGKEVQQSVAIAVSGTDVEPSPTLAVRNFRFLRSEKDGDGLNPASYRPGDPIWARFEIVGYREGDKNAYQVDFGLSITNPAGEVLFTNDPAADDSGSPYYPQKYVRGVLSVTTQKDTPTGDYILVLFVRDRLGNQVSETKHPYRLE